MCINKIYAGGNVKLVNKTYKSKKLKNTQKTSIYHTL